jgi:hypothetical protein
MPPSARQPTNVQELESQEEDAGGNSGQRVARHDQNEHGRDEAPDDVQRHQNQPRQQQPAEAGGHAGQQAEAGQHQRHVQAQGDQQGQRAGCKRNQGSGTPSDQTAFTIYLFLVPFHFLTIPGHFLSFFPIEEDLPSFKTSHLLLATDLFSFVSSRRKRKEQSRQTKKKPVWLASGAGRGANFPPQNEASLIAFGGSNRFLALAKEGRGPLPALSFLLLRFLPTFLREFHLLGVHAEGAVVAGAVFDDHRGLASVELKSPIRAGSAHGLNSAKALPASSSL